MADGQNKTQACEIEHQSRIEPALFMSTSAAIAEARLTQTGKLAGKARQVGTRLTRHASPAPRACRVALHHFATNRHE